MKQKKNKLHNQKSYTKPILPHKKGASRGFTLIELMVVISIISLLASILATSLNSARIKGRDAKRIEDMEQMQKAVELYYNDHNTYPPSGGATNGPNGAWSNSTDSSWQSSAVFPTAMAPYVAKLPTDPLNQSGWLGAVNPTGVYQYSYYSCGTDYMLVYSLEVATGHASPGATVCGSTYNYVGAGAITITFGQ